MSREVRRVPLDFVWPLDRVWWGYLQPDVFDEAECPDCEVGFAPHAQFLYDQFYGKAPFDPASTGSTALTPATPAVRAFAERNVTRSPEFYGAGEAAIIREGQRLCDLWNAQWSHHLDQDDVDALVAAGRLWDFTHTWTPGKGWEDKVPPYTPTAAEVNEWHILGSGHDGINAGRVVAARCERDGYEVTCPTCNGHGSVEAFPGQRAAAETWEPTEPPKGEGWQLWETVTEGSPISAVFKTPEALARAIATPETPYSAALRWITGPGWAPSFVADSTGVHAGIDASTHLLEGTRA